MKGLVLAAGKGTRLKPITFSIPKPLIPIANKPVFLYSVSAFIESNINDIGIVISKEHENDFKRAISESGLDKLSKFEYIIQPEPKGLANAVSCAKDFIGNEPFVVQLGDNIIFHDYSSFINDNSKCKILLAPVDDISRYGIAEFNNNKIIKLIEKPKKSKSNYAMVGLYKFPNEIFDYINDLQPSLRGEYEITDAISELLIKYNYLDYDICNYWWKDVGTPSDMLLANAFILDSILGKPACIDDSSSFSNMDIIKGVSIGNNCTIQNCKVDNSIVLGNVTLENINISDSIIGPNSIIRGNQEYRIVTNIIVGDNTLINII